MSTFDPLDVAFRAGQELYKAGLLSLINARRQTRGRAPVGWPQVAVTPSDVMWHEGDARLTALSPRRPAPAGETPLLLVCSLINRPYVLDLLAERSVVRPPARLRPRRVAPRLGDAGRRRRDAPPRSLRARAAAARRRRRSPARRQRRLHVLGYCMGGTLALHRRRRRQAARGLARRDGHAGRAPRRRAALALVPRARLRSRRDRRRLRQRAAAPPAAGVQDARPGRPGAQARRTSTRR